MPEATPAAAPTAPIRSPASSASTSNTGTSTSNSGSMSVKDFRQSLLNRSAAKSTSEPETSSADFSDESTSDDNTSQEFSAEPVEQQVAEATTDEQPDWSWAEPLSAFREGVHGVATHELLQALAAGQLPEALFDKLSLTMNADGEEWTGNIADLRNGAQMQSVFTKKSQALAAEKKQFESERSELIDYLRGWKDDALSDAAEAGEKGLLGLEKMLGQDAMLKIAQRLAVRLERKAQLEAAEAAGHIPPGTAAAILEREALVQQNQELERFRARQEQQTSQQNVDEQGKALGQKINTEAVKQFKAAGLSAEDGSLTQGVWNLFTQELGALWTDPSRAPTQVEIRTAVLAAKQNSERLVRQHQAEQAARAARGGGSQKPAVVGAAPAGAPGVPKKSAASGSKAMSTKQFKDQVLNAGKRPFGGR